MIEDDLMKEIRAAKDAYARSFGYNIRAIVADLQAADARGDWPLVRCSPPDAEVENSTDGRPRPRVVGVVGPIDGSGREGRETSTLRDISISREGIATPSRIGIGQTVAVAVAVPALGLTTGEVGAVVEILGEGAAFAVEFCDNLGATYGLHSLRADQLIVLHSRGQALRLRVGAV